MAVTALWRIKGYIGKVLIYAENPEKTLKPETISIPDEFNRDSLEDVISYAERDEATNHRQLVWGINCTAENARREMMAVKRQFQKEDGTIAYHGYQSFREGEVSPELAHQIGIRLATQLWGDRYQVLVATHLDKESHLHNHFVINTVSFVDGIKFHRTKGDYRQMQIVSDALCKEYGLSVIEKPMGKGKHYLEYQAEKSGKPTWKTYIRDDVDAAIRSSMTFQQFVRNMRERGYAIERRATTLRLLPPGRERFVRFDTLGESYTEDAIISRILKQQKREHPPTPTQPVVRKAKVYGDFRLSKITWKGLRALYFFYLRKLREAQRQPAGYAPYILREELRLMDAISEQSKFVFRHKLDTAEQVETLKSSLLTQVQALTAERTQQRNLKRRQGVSEKDIEQIDTRISELSNQLKSLRKEIKLCDSVIERSLLIQAKNEQLKILKGKEKEKNEPARRSGRTSREYGDKHYH